MAIDSQNVGSNSRPINIIGDPVTAANMGAVLGVADGTSMAGKFAQMVESINAILNSGGTYDIARATPGVTGVPLVCIESIKNTYSAGIISLSLAATATDFFTIFGSGTKTVRVTNIEVYGMATAAATVDLQLLRRSTANTSGTSSTPTSILHDTSNAAATAALTIYTANPTLGTSVGLVRASKLNLGAAGSAGSVKWTFGTKNDQALVLRGATQGLCLNWNAQAVPSGTLISTFIEWVEDAS